MYRPPVPNPYGGGAPSYGSSSSGYGYPPPPVSSTPSYGYNTPPPPHVPSHAPAVDPFRAYYASRLSQLTFNSRPIIQDLSMTAMHQRDAQNWTNMQAVVDEIEAATLRAPPTAKLPMLYLIDSISKNVGAPYTTNLLPPIIPRLYQKTYREVDGVTKSKMEEMIALWRTSGPNRTDLYGPDVRYAIERDILGSAGGFARQQQPPASGPGQPPPTREAVLALLHSTLDSKQRESAAKPWDSTPRSQIDILSKIGQLLATTQVSNIELSHIMDQLRSMAPQTSPQPMYANPAAPTIGRPAPNLPPFPPAMPPMPPTLSTPNPATSTPGPSNSTPIPKSSTPLPAPVALPVSLPPNVADILRNLNTSGILNKPRTPDTQPASRAPTTAPAKSALEAYEDMVLAMDLRLENLDLNRLKALPTAHLPQRCKQCGIRIPEGEAKMQAHLDWHFRRNKQKTETASGRGAHRRWLPKAEEWVVDLGSSNAEAGPSSASKQSAGGAAGGANKLSAEQLARYAARYVKAPQDPVKAGRPCPICKEHFKAELEDDEWIWRNAIEINGVVYHATCRAEQMNARKNARMLNPAGGRSSASKSPGVTPQPGEADVKPDVKASPSSLARAAVQGVPDASAQAPESQVQVKQEPGAAPGPMEQERAGGETRQEGETDISSTQGGPDNQRTQDHMAPDAARVDHADSSMDVDEAGSTGAATKRKAEGEDDTQREDEAAKRVKVEDPLATDAQSTETTAAPNVPIDATTATGTTDTHVTHAGDSTGAATPLTSDTVTTSLLDQAPGNDSVRTAQTPGDASTSATQATPAPSAAPAGFDGIPGFGRM